MLFNSIDFVLFLPTVFFLYWFIANRNSKFQNLLILISSYFFYGWWDWRYLYLIAFGSAVNYFAGVGLVLTNNQLQRKIILTISAILSLGILCVFKYFNFFVESLVAGLNSIGVYLQFSTLDIVLPIGISFYTFRMLSYTIDVYRNKISPTKDVVAFFAYISLFTQLAAGPIERAENLLPQFYKQRVFNYSQAVDGLRQMLWGFFKKIVIADNCAIIVNDVFQNYQTLPGSVLLVGAVYFSFQIYCDFSGYSDIAIGCSRLFGFESMKNFAYPYFSRDIAEFWRRWHISLTSWFRVYLYIPLGGSRGTKFKTIRNTFIIFLVCGFWHGANWTFIAWGFINAIYFLPLLLLGTNRKNLGNVGSGRTLPNIREVSQMVITFVITTFAWIFFKADSISQGVSYIKHIFSMSLFSIPRGTKLRFIIPLILLLIIVEWLQRDKQHGLDLQSVSIPLGIKWLRSLRWAMYYGIILAIIYFAEKPQEFIYFQF